MLVLTRRIGETLLIGQDVAVTLLSVKGNQARIGVSAPRGTQVRRNERRSQAPIPGDDRSQKHGRRPTLQAQ